VKTEFDLIAALRERLPDPGPGVLVGSGDDAAVTEPVGRPGATTVDAIVEGVHFTLPEFPAEAVGRKALAAALSDLAAMAAEPAHAYVVLGVPPHASDELLISLADGIAEVAGREGVSVIGGDVTRSPSLTLAVTCVGHEPEGGRLVTRAGAQVGDVVAVTGELGGAAAALELLTSGDPEAGAERAARGGSAALDPAVRDALLPRQLDPRPRLDAGAALSAAGATAMIDVSDGVGADAGHVARASGARVQLEAHLLPLAEGLRELYGSEDRALATAISGGEDFELLVTLPEEGFERAAEAVATYGLTQIGRVMEPMEGEDVTILASDGRALEPGGFDHMRGSRSG
jgi:thiamine-monophosphate kinase